MRDRREINGGKRGGKQQQTDEASGTSSVDKGDFS